MPIRSSAVGAELGPRTVEVTPRMALAYAAGISDIGPFTFDDAAAEPLVAPPPFAVVIEWGVLTAPDRRAVLDMTPDEASRSVHAGQDSTFHRPIRAGDRLRTTGRIVEARQTRAGALVMIRLNTVDAATGAPVVTTWFSTISRGVPLDGEPVSLETPPSWPPASASPQRETRIPISREAGHVYTECSGIWNPIHTERRVALGAGLPDIILHGTATWAMAGREIVKEYAGGDPRRLLRLRGRFKGMVIPPTEVTLVHSATPSRDGVHFVVRTEPGELAIVDGYAQIAPPQ